MFRDELRGLGETARQLRAARAVHRHRRHAHLGPARRRVPRLDGPRDLGLRTRRRCSTRSTDHWQRPGLEERDPRRAIHPQHRRRRGRGRHRHVPASPASTDRGRRRDHLAGSGRAGRRRHAVRLPHGHLPHLRRHRCVGPVRDLRSGEEHDGRNEYDPDLHLGRRRRLHPRTSRPHDPRHDRRTRMAIRRRKEYTHLTRRRGRGDRPRARRDPRRGRGRRAAQDDATTSTGIITHPASTSPPRVASPCSPASSRRPGCSAPRCWARPRSSRTWRSATTSMHGQWDWMNDPEIHSSTWEWDTVQPAEQWKHSHNYMHHKFTNVLGKDNDIGYGILRMSREQKWTPVQPGPAGLQLPARGALRVGRRAARPRHRGDPQGQEGSQGAQEAAQADRRARSAGRREGLRDVPGC